MDGEKEGKTIYFQILFDLNNVSQYKFKLEWRKPVWRVNNIYFCRKKLQIPIDFVCHLS